MPESSTYTTKADIHVVRRCLLMICSNPSEPILTIPVGAWGYYSPNISNTNPTYYHAYVDRVTAITNPMEPLFSASIRLDLYVQWLISDFAPSLPIQPSFVLIKPCMCVFWSPLLMSCCLPNPNSMRPVVPYPIHQHIYQAHDQRHPTPVLIPSREQLENQPPISPSATFTWTSWSQCLFSFF
jgi:hypothetical protein